MIALHDLSASELLASYKSKKLSPVDVVDAVIMRIEAWEPKLKALYAPDFEGSRKAAKESEKRRQAGNRMNDAIGRERIDDQPIVGKRRTTGFERLKHQRGHVVIGIPFGGMLARTIRAFYLQVVHLVHRLRISQDVVSSSAHITAKEVTELVSVFPHIQNNLGRAEDMPGITKSYSQAVRSRKRPIVVNGHELSHRLFRIGGTIEWFNRRQAPLGALL